MNTVFQRVVVVLALVVGLGWAAGHLSAAKPKKDAAKKDAKDEAADDGSKKDKKTGDKGGAVFEVYKDKGGKFRFRLKGGDKKSLAIAPRGFKTRGDCQKVIETIKRNAAKARVVEKGK
jgi:uncharacterized protein YegP (UPF0339 family)